MYTTDKEIPNGVLRLNAEGSFTFDRILSTVVRSLDHCAPIHLRRLLKVLPGTNYIVHITYYICITYYIITKIPSLVLI